MSNRIPILTAALLVAGAALAGAAFAGSTNGVAGAMPAYYDGNLFKINFMALPGSATGTVLGHNNSVNTIYMSDTPVNGGMFVAVLDAIQGGGFNPLWLEESITFNAGHEPRQITSDNDVLAAVASGEITLRNTGELYRCSVIGQKPQPTAGGAAADGRTAAPAGTSATHATSWGMLKQLYR
jgi:hypothetical protein